MKIKFLPILALELKKSKNPPRLRYRKEYKVIETMKEDNGEELIKIKDDRLEPLWLPMSEKGILFEVIEER